MRIAVLLIQCMLTVVRGVSPPVGDAQAALNISLSRITVPSVEADMSITVTISDLGAGTMARSFRYAAIHEQLSRANT